VDSIYAVSPEGYLEFSAALFQQCMREYLADEALTVHAADFLGEVGVTATTRMKYAGKNDKLLGLFHYRVTYTSGGQKRAVEMLVKSKTHYRELVERLAGVLVNSGVQVPDVAGLLAQTELHNTHMKEITVFRMQRSNLAFTRVLPRVYGTYVDDARQVYLVLEEFLAGAYVMKDYTRLDEWSYEWIRRMAFDFCGMHAAFYGKYDAPVAEGWLGKTMDAGVMQQLAPLWQAYADKMRYFVGKLFDQSYLDMHRRWIDTIPEWWGRIDRLKKTLIFNDAQIRNLAVRDPQTDPHLVLFDWECTSIQLPQRDLVEFIAYAVSDRVSDAEIDALFEATRTELERLSGQAIDRRDWLEGFRLSVFDLHVNRMACQLTLHITLNRPDIERVFRASMRILARIEQALGIAQSVTA
jgi:hypothetical protein